MPIQLKDFTASPNFQVTEVVLILRKYGVVLIPNWLTKEDLKKLSDDWHAIRNQRYNEDCLCVHRVGGNVADYAALYRSKPNAEQFQAVNQIFNHPKIIELVNRIVGRPNLLNEEIYATYDLGKGEEIASSHFDKTWNIKCMIYLHDILGPGYGAFAVHPGSQYLARRKFKNWFQKNCSNNSIEIGTPEFYGMGNEEIPDELGECIEIFAPAGSMIIFSTDVFHRGSYLKEGRERKIIRGHTYPGYQLPGSGDKIRKYLRQWLRGEQWELHNKQYKRFSRDGFLEWKNYKKNKRA
ncbi:hypothetical protein OQJ35_04380 [Legionella pneumophila]|uniref:hypothetical protein n=1 Tax=Legionella TaxID=445 RepID=UPI0007773B3E|nr:MULTISPECIES: hypothetical protein [Legionella]MCW8420791.1 hypothetical protein [Legionella sp. PATHC032]MCW8427762.1 hypothetical protein [Legionella pneumophila]HAT1820639.1 hypothetical protein [Legionella pneumophila]HAT6809171.1 hypothetical protein [Legionella pneumophila]HAT8670088.1 hypothetical protein [Legionella pneumophila]